MLRGWGSWLKVTLQTVAPKCLTHVNAGREDRHWRKQNSLHEQCFLFETLKMKKNNSRLCFEDKHKL